MKTIFSGFAQFADADAVVQALEAANFPVEELNVLVDVQTAKSNLDEVNRARVHVDVTDAVGERVLSGLALLVGNQQPVEVRGLGQVYATGQLATILASSATAGGQSGDDAQAMLVSYGVPAERAAAYQKLVHEGGVLLWLRSAEQRVSTAAEVFHRHNGQSMIANP